MSRRVNVKAFRTEMPGHNSLADVALEAASVMVSHVIPHLPKFEAGEVTEVGGETTIGTPDGGRLRVSFWVRDGDEHETPLADAPPAGNA